MSESSGAYGLTKHRVEALTDGIFAVAMTLLVIELKIPETARIENAAQFHAALAHLIPKFIAWIVSFLVLAIFWIGHHRLFHQLRHVDSKLIMLTMIYLGFASLMPFSSALTGEYGNVLAAQIFYSANMAMLGIMALLKSRYVYRHPELCITPMPRSIYKSARLRMIGLLCIAIAAVLITWAVPDKGAIGNTAFMLMIVFGKISRRIEAKEMALEAAAKQQAATQST